MRTQACFCASLWLDYATRKNLPFISLVLALILFISCRSGILAEIPLSPVAQEIQARGYRVQKSFALAPTDWEISKFRMRSKVVVDFKAEHPLPNENDKYYCRFSLAEEIYDSYNDARQRLAQLHDAFPDGPREDEYTRVLREGFVSNRTVYILQTDASIFHSEIRRLTNILAASRAGADQ